MSSTTPCEGRDRLVHDGAEVEAANENNAPTVAINLPLEVIPLPVVGCFFDARIFFRKGLVGEKFEYWDSVFNESTSW